MRNILYCVLSLASGAAMGFVAENPQWARPVHRAEDFVESMGLAASPFDRYLDSGRFAGAGTRYAPEVFFDLGIRYYRNSLFHDLTNPEQPKLVMDWYRRTGARPLMLVDPGKLRTLKLDWMNVPSDGDFTFLLDKLAEYDPEAIAGLEGPNELNNKFPPQDLNLKYRGATDEAAGAMYQNDLFRAVRGDPRTASIPIVMFTAIFTDYSLARPCSSFDYLNMHSYQGSDVPSASLMMNMRRSAHILPDGAVVPPVQPTECGYNIELDKTNRQGYTGSARSQAYGIPMLYAEYFRHGIPRTYLFALHNADGYGLLESDQETKRPSYYAVKSLVSVLSDSKWNPETLKWEGEGRTFTPRTLLFNISGAPESVHTLLLQKASGTWYLLIWNEKRNFDNGASVYNPPVRATLEFSKRFRSSAQVCMSRAKLVPDLKRRPKRGRSSCLTMFLRFLRITCLRLT